MTLLSAFGGVELLIILIVVIFGAVLPIIALVDIVKGKFEGNSKLIWVIIVLFSNVIGSILYFTIGKKQKLID